jgi:hypothetical protein
MASSPRELREPGAAPPDVVHAHFWMSGWPRSRPRARIPVVQTFHALGSVKRRHQGAPTPARPSGSRSSALVAPRRPRRRHLLRRGVRARAHGRRRAALTSCRAASTSRCSRPDGPGRARRRAAHRLSCRRPAGRAQGPSATSSRAGRTCPTPSWSSPAARRPRRARRRPGGARLRGARRREPRRRRPARAARPVGPRRRAGAAALGRRRGVRAVVRAVRHHPAGGDGLRRAGGRHRGRRPGRHRRRRRHRRPRAAARPGRARRARCARCSVG